RRSSDLGVLQTEPAGVAPVVPPLVAEDGLEPVVVLLRIEVEVVDADAALPRVLPAGQRPRLLPYVTLVVRAAIGAEREQLHHLARVVLVRRVLTVVGPVEPHQHRG